MIRCGNHMKNELSVFKIILSNPSPQLSGSTHGGTSVVLSILNLRLPDNQVELVGEYCFVGMR